LTYFARDITLDADGQLWHVRHLDAVDLADELQGLITASPGETHNLGSFFYEANGYGCPEPT
jgi:hypothetical protein